METKLMGQDECLNILKKKKRWVASTEICKTFEQGAGVINRSLRKLRDQGLIERRKKKRDWIFEYEWRVIPTK